MQINLTMESGFCYFVDGFQQVHSMLLGKHDSPKLRAWAHDGFVICTVLSWVLVLLCTWENGGDLHELIGKTLIRPRIISMVCIVAVYCCHASHRFCCGWL